MHFIQVNTKVKNHLIIGDVKFDKKTKDHFYNLSQSGYQSMINTCKHLNKKENEGSCIHHIFVKGNPINTAGKQMESISDHYAVFIWLHDNNAQTSQKEKCITSKKKFIDLCNLESWDEIYEIEDNEKAMQLLIDK